MKQNERIADIYQIDTNGIDLARGIEEDETVDLDVLIKHTKQKLYKNKKRTIRDRFYLANNFVKAAMIAGAIVLGATTVTATVMVAKYIPNRGVSQSENIMVLPAPFTVTVENKSGNGEAKYCYLRIVSLSYDGKMLEMDLETNWKEKSQNENSAGYISVETSLKGEDDIKKSIPGKSTAYFGEKITQLHQVYEVSDLEKYSLILPFVSEDTNIFEIPLKELQLVEPKKVESVEQLGQVAEDQGIRLVAVKSRMKDTQNIDFIPSKQPHDITFEGLQEYVIKDVAGKELQVLDTDSNYGALPYLLLKCKSDFKGQVEVSKLQVSKSVNQNVSLEIPKAGQTNKINKIITLNGMNLIIESIYVEDIPDNQVGGYWVEVVCEVKLPDDSYYSIGSGTRIKNSLFYKDLEQASYSFKDGKTWISIPIPTEEFKPGETMTLQLECIKGLTLAGEWSWNME